MRPRIQLLEDALIDRILTEAKHILAEVGMEVRGPELRRRLLDAGLPTRADGRVLFPPDVVERAIATTPRSFTLFDRDGQPCAEPVSYTHLAGAKDELLAGVGLHLGPGRVGRLGQPDVARRVVRQADDARMVLRTAAGVAHLELLQPQHVRAQPPRRPVKRGTAQATETEYYGVVLLFHGCFLQ